MFAHASGFSWDEALMVMVPIALIAGVLFLANSRAKKLQDTPTDADVEPNTAPDRSELGRE